MLKQRRINCLMTICPIVLITFACAGYPDEPREPKLGADIYTVEEDTLLAVPADKGILANDSPREGEKNYLIEVNGQKAVEGERLILNLNGGKIVIKLDGSFTYEPKKDFNGTDQLIYRVRNLKGRERSGRSSIQVTPVNDPPLAEDDRLSILSTRRQSIDVLANDTDPDGDDIRISGIGDLENGSASITDDGMTILFSPNANHTGDVNFSYTVADESNEEAQAWVFLTHGDGGNNLVRPDAITAAEDSSVTVSFGRLLANDQVDPNTDIEFGSAHNGAVRASGDRTFTYTPNSNFTGTDYFTYSVEIQGGITASTTVTVIVTSAADAPIIADIPNQRIGMGQTLGPVLFSVENVDESQTGLNIRAAVSNAAPPNLIPEGGISIVGSAGSRAIWITPAPDLAGSATITITVSNGQVESSDSFQLTVEPVGPSPSSTIGAADASRNLNLTTQDMETPSDVSRVSALRQKTGAVSASVNMMRSSQRENSSFQTAEDLPLNVGKERGLLSNHPDRTMRVVSLAPICSCYGGQVQLKADGGFNYMPAVNFTGQDSFQYTLRPSEKHAAASTRKAVVLVSAVNDAPLAQSDLYWAPPGTVLQIGPIQGVLANDRDVEDQPLEVIPQNTKRLRLNADGSFTYRPAEGFSGRDLFTYTVSDGDKHADATLELMVGNRPVPSAQADAYRTAGGGLFNQERAQGLLANDSEPEGVPLSIYETGVFDTLFGGEVNIRIDGGFSYQPPLNFDGYDSFSYTLTNGRNCVSQVAVISVTP